MMISLVTSCPIRLANHENPHEDLGLVADYHVVKDLVVLATGAAESLNQGLRVLFWNPSAGGRRGAMSSGARALTDAMDGYP